jgi:hypothetical protein
MRQPRTRSLLLLVVTAVAGVIGLNVAAWAWAQGAQTAPMPSACSTEPDVAIRLYYNPLVQGEGKAHSPCILLPVSAEDPRLGMRPAWILYDLHADIRAVVSLLSRQQLQWNVTPTRMKLVVEPFDLPGPQHNSMQIAVTCPLGSAVTDVPPKQICTLLSNISNALSNSEARASFEFYRQTISCQVDDAAAKRE